jgi:hypothetical protein
MLPKNCIFNNDNRTYHRPKIKKSLNYSKNYSSLVIQPHKLEKADNNSMEALTNEITNKRKRFIKI